MAALVTMMPDEAVVGVRFFSSGNLPSDSVPPPMFRRARALLTSLRDPDFRGMIHLCTNDKHLLIRCSFFSFVQQHMAC
jgi:hypothetical protein